MLFVIFSKPQILLAFDLISLQGFKGSGGMRETLEYPPPAPQGSEPSVSDL